MADTTNNIIIAIPNNVDPGIAPRLIDIGNAADRAEKSVGNLKAQLASVGSSGLGGLLGMLNEVQGATRAVAASQNSATTQVQANTTVVTANAAARKEQAVAARAAALADRQAAAEAKAFLQSEADYQAALTRGFVEAAEAQDALQTKWQKELISQDQRIAKELELARARELSNLKADIISRSATNAEQAAEATAATQAQAEADAQLSAASTLLAERQEIEAAAYLQLAEATTTLREAKLGLSQLQKDVNEGNITEEAGTTLLAAALVREAEATEQLTLAKSNLAEVQTYLANTTSVQTRAVTENAQVTQQAAGQVGTLTTKFYAAQGASALFAGRLPIRAFERFISLSGSLSDILVKAFPVIGAIALVEIIYKASEAFVKFIINTNNAARNIALAFDAIENPLRKTNDELALSNDKLDRMIAKLEHKPTTNGALLALDEARVMADKLDDSLEKVGKDLDTILKKNQVGFFGGLFTNQATTRDTSKFIEQQWLQIQAAQDRAKTALDNAALLKDPTASQNALKTAYEDERKAIDDVTKAIVARYNATKTLQDTQKAVTIQTPYGPQTTHPADQTANLTELGKAGHLAEQELRNLDLTMANMVKNQTADRLRDQQSGLRLEVKEAAAQWKALEAAFVQYQTTVDKSGHKPTAEQSLGFLVGKESSILPLNKDKLAAKELPFQNQIAQENQFRDETLTRLQDQASGIGQYSDALKESAEMNRILEQAKRRNITLTDGEIASYKQLIAQVIENRDYDRSLATVYGSVTDAGKQYTATLQAISTLHAQGKLTDAQALQGIIETTKEYREATNAVTGYTNALAIDQRDQAARVGSQKQLAVIQQLQALDAQLRKPGVDAAHPFGYSEQEITRVNDSLRSLIKSQQDSNAVREQSNALINKQTDLEDQLRIKEQSLQAAVKAGALSQEAANSERIRSQVQLNDERLANGKGNGLDAIKNSVLDYMKDFTTLADGIQKAFKPVFRTLADGFADSLGRALVYGEKLGSALKDVARSAISELISGLVKLGIQYVLNLTLGTAAATAATAATVALASATAAAWAPAAIAASIATLGAADGIGAAAYAGALITGQVLTAIPRLATGTNKVPTDMFAMIHQDERVVPAADNRALIAAVQNGGSNHGGTMHVEVHNYNGSRVEVQHMTEGKVRMIISDMAPDIVAQHAPKVIAGEVSDPNSRVSKSLTRSTYSTRRR